VTSPKSVRAADKAKQAPAEVLVVAVLLMGNLTTSDDIRKRFCALLELHLGRTP
jgi:hypothetical protein